MQSHCMVACSLHTSLVWLQPSVSARRYALNHDAELVHLQDNIIAR